MRSAASTHAVETRRKKQSSKKEVAVKASPKPAPKAAAKRAPREAATKASSRAAAVAKPKPTKAARKGVKKVAPETKKAARAAVQTVDATSKGAARAAASKAAPQPNPMMELSHKNHFKFGYNDQWFVERRTPEDKWSVGYGRCERPIMDWRAECIDTAHKIRAATDLDLWVMLSGGIDSEVVVQSFLFAGIKFSAAITCFRNDLNRQDVRMAVKFCEMHHVPYKLLHLDIEQFFESGTALEYADRTKSVHPVLLHTMWAMDQVDGYPILGSAECYLVKPDQEEPSPIITAGSSPRGRKSAANGMGPHGTTAAKDEPVWDMFEKERIASWYRHLVAQRRPGCAGFFQYTPEVMLAFLRDPTMIELCTGKIPGEVDTMKRKPSIYRKYFLLEPRTKYTGFENVLHLDDSLRPELERRWGAYDGIVKTSYTDLVEGLTYKPGA
jgi:hypothetical protein